MPEIYQPTTENFEKAESLMTNDQREMSHQRKEKGNTLRNIRKEIDETGDALGKPIDEGIKETVVFLNALDVPTTGSCEGHTDMGLPWPWIDTEDPDQPEEQFENQKKIFEYFAKKNNLDIEKLKKGEPLNIWLKARSEASKNQETEEYKEWTKKK